MAPAPMPHDERDRVAALRQLDILDTAPEALYDAFTDLARSLFGTPMAALSLVDAERQWFKSAIGLPAQHAPRDTSFCAHAILQPDRVMVVPDALLDARFAANPLVTADPGIRFYAGAPLRDRDGFVLGSLCVLDRQPREVDADLLNRLAQIAAGASATLQLAGCLRQLGRMALIDPLTGLANRAAFDRRLDEVCGAGGTADRGHPGATLLMFDLDGFKGINDLFGHPGGDRALCEVARRLSGVARSGDMIARFGGDEFAMLCAGELTGDAALAVAARVHAVLADTFHIDGEVVPLRTSIGAAMLPQHAGGPAALLAAADAALYVAKRGGRGVTRLAQAPGAPVSEASVSEASVSEASVSEAPVWDAPVSAAVSEAEPGPVGRLTIQSLLRDALRPGGRHPFDLHFQPILEVASGRVRAFEALLRWTLEDGQRVSPADFVPVAEECGLVGHLDRWVLFRACATARAWPEAWCVSVNMSPATVALIDVVELVGDALAAAGLAPGRLRIEITETVKVADPARLARAMRGLRDLGVAVSADDFGSGYASFASLRQFAFDTVKVDRSLVAGLGTDPKALPVLRALIGLTQALSMPAVAEGVETAEQFHLLHALRVSRVQGYLFGRPVPAGELFRSARMAEARLGLLLDGGAGPARTTAQGEWPLGTAAA